MVLKFLEKNKANQSHTFTSMHTENKHFPLIGSSNEIVDVQEAPLERLVAGLSIKQNDKLGLDRQLRNRQSGRSFLNRFIN
jgi:hypothetical protein